MPKENLSAIKAEQLVSDMMSRITLRNRRCDCTVLNRHAPNKKTDDAKDNLYEEFGSIFNYFHKCHMKICKEVVIQNWRVKIFATDSREWEFARKC
jgi:hypothetical protein